MPCSCIMVEDSGDGRAHAPIVAGYISVMIQPSHKGGLKELSFEPTTEAR